MKDESGAVIEYVFIKLVSLELYSFTEYVDTIGIPPEASVVGGVHDKYAD